MFRDALGPFAERQTIIMKRDKLTGLLYYDDFRKMAPEIIKNIEGSCMLLSINISNFKYINSVYGYEKGDQLLFQIADHFCHNNKNCVLASRIHSDRFVALVHLVESAHPDYLTKFFKYKCDEFARKIEQEYPMATFWIHSGAYIIKDSNENISEMFDKAEFARKNIRDDSSTTLCIFDEKLEQRGRMERRIIPLFERALMEDGIQVYLQPKIDVDTQRIVGAEALARLVDEDGKIIPPNMFIPVLERYGLIVQLDMYVTRKVFSILNSWKSRGMKLIPISLNLSRIDFKQNDEWINSMKVMEPLLIPNEYVEFEVTETVFFEDVSVITNLVRRLREKGFRISMDDFGTGFSSLNTLGMLPLDCIKFDRGFVQNSINTPKGLEIMAGLIDIFTKINLDVICEGVETSEEEQIVRSCGCRKVQGYLHDKPLPILDFERKYLEKASL